MEGFLMQRTNFKYEVIIGEDCSTDNTRKIVQEYCDKYPEMVHLVYSDKNVGGHRNIVRVLDQAKGKYIAFCDGDDFWTSPDKLQKQVDFLENNPDYVICCHYTREIDFSGNLLYVNENPVSLKYEYGDLVINKQAETCTATMVVRGREMLKDLYKKHWFLNCHAVDKFMKLFATSTTGKKIYVLPEVMSSYRKHPGGVWSMVPQEVLRQKQLNDFNLIINHFEHNLQQKVSLLIFYIRRYFLFQLRKYTITHVFSTIRAIL